MIPKDVIERVKKETNLLDLLHELMPSLAIKKVHKHLYSSCCPHPDHKDDTPSFRLWRHTDGSWSWACMGCHAGKKDKTKRNFGSDAIALLEWLSSYEGSPKVYSFYDAVTFLAKRLGIPIVDPHDKTYEALDRKVHRYHQNLTPSAKAYLYERGLSDKEITEFTIGLHTEDESGRNVSRIIFPIKDAWGRCVGYIGRALNEEDASFPKYKNSPTSAIFKKGALLYNLDKVKRMEEDSVYITEGVLDVITAYSFGLKSVVATLGTAFTEEHAHLIKSLGKKPYLLFDGDEAGRKGAERAVDLLVKEGLSPKVLYFPEGKDLADMANEYAYDIEEYVVSHAKHYYEYALESAILRYEKGVENLRLSLLPSILPALHHLTTYEESIAFKTYIKERTGIIL